MASIRQLSLFADAKVLKDISQDFICCYLTACYLRELLKTNAEIFTDQIATKAHFHGQENS